MLEIKKCLAPHVLVKRLSAEGKYPGTMIVLPDAQNYKNRRCEVVQVHEGRRYRNGEVHSCTVKPGDLVEAIVFDGYIYDPYEQPDMELVNEDEILAIVEEVNE